MGILDNVPGIVSGALGTSVFKDCQISYVSARASDGRGGYTHVTETVAGKGLVTDYSERLRAQTGIADDERKVLVLGHGLGRIPKAGDIITIDSARWKVVLVTTDPAGAVYACRVAPAGLTVTGCAGALAVTLGDLTLTAAGTAASAPEGVFGVLDATLAGVSLSGAASALVEAQASITLDDATASGAGATSVSGTLAVTLEDVTCDAVDYLGYRATLDATLSDLTSAGQGSVSVSGSLAVTLDDVASTGSASALVQGVLARQLEDLALSASASAPISGTLSRTLGALTVTATGWATAPSNVIPLSEQSDFSSSNWPKTRITYTSDAANDANGDPIADLIAANTVNSTHTVARDFDVVAGNYYEFSVELKSNGLDADLRFNANGFGANLRYIFDLTNGTVTEAVAGTLSFGTITDLGGGWYRCAIRAQATANATVTAYIMLDAGGGTLSFAGDNVSGVYMAHASLGQSDAPPVSGIVAQTLEDASLVAAGSVSVLGQANLTLADVSASGAASVTVSGTLSTSLAALTLAAAGTAASGSASPTVVWTAAHYGDTALDLTGYDIQVGDVLIGFALGFYTNGGSGGLGWAVANGGWASLFTNDSSANATHCSCLVLDAGNIGSASWRHGSSAANSMVMCIRGADTSAFAATADGSGFLIVDNPAAILAAAGVSTQLDTGSMSVATAGSLALSFGGYRTDALTYTAPSGYTLEGQDGNSISLAIASKEGVSAGTEDPGAFGHTAQSSGRGYTMIIPPAP